MSLAAAIRALQSAGIKPTGREIAEALWLAQHLTPRPMPTEAPQLEQPGTDHDEEQTDVSPQSSSPSTTEPVALSIASSAAGSRVHGHPVQVPDLPGLYRPRDIQRALRPLRHYGPSRRHLTLDEDATATFIANTGVWAPVMRPAPERWFDVVLAVDSSSSMDLWRPLVRDLHTMLAGTGAFRDIRTWRLKTERQAVIVQPNRKAVARSPRELIDGSGRRLFIVVTDGAAHGWHDGSAANVLADWGKTGPVAILQPLPEVMWARTGLTTVPARLSTNGPGTRNSQLRVDYRRRRRITGVPIPVLGIEPHALHSWARLVVGSASAVPLAVTPANGDRPILPPLIGQNEFASAIDRFRASASPEAYQLAVCMSAVPLTLPIMRLIQHVAVPASSPSTLAEVILGGLISRTGDNSYEFLPGIRDVLLSELRRSEITTVFSAMSHYIAQQAGMGTSTFPAIAETPDGPVAADAEAFSWVPSAVAARLGLPGVSPPNLEDRSRDQAISLTDKRNNEQASASVKTALDAAGKESASDGASRVARQSAYLQQVRRIAPPELMDREADLAELTRFCLEPGRGPYLLLQAQAYAGKTALLSSFVLHPPKGTRVVSFFVTDRLSGQDTREGFTQALLEQLAELTRQELPAVLPDGTRETYLLDLLFQAAHTCHNAGERLVLVVDGLDADRGVATGPDAYSIAGLLPADPPAGMRVIATMRHDVPIPSDVPDWHPMRNSRVIQLSNSPHARDMQLLGMRELQRLLNGTSVERDLLGLLTAAGGGLTALDLVGLTGVRLLEVEKILHTKAGRTLTRRASRWSRGTAPEVYMLGHEELRAAAFSYFGQRMDDYQDRLHAWADTYRAQGWPPRTPEYLLSGYFRLLRTTGDLPRMLDLALDPARQDRRADLTDNDDATMAEIVTIQNLIVNSSIPDPGPAMRARIAAILDGIQRRNPHIPTALPAVWAFLGQQPQALSVARSISDPQRQAEALAEVARVTAAGGKLHAAESLTRSIIDPYWRSAALASVAEVLAKAGQYTQAGRVTEEAEVAARSITDSRRQADALAQVTRVIASISESETEEQIRIVGDRGHVTGKTSGVIFVADAFAAWLVGLIADAGRKKLTTLVLGSAQERALRQAAEKAIGSTATELEPSDSDRATQLAMVVSEVFRDLAPTAPQARQVTLLETLQTGITERLGVLSDDALTGTGQSSAEILGVPGGVLAEILARHLLREIMLRGSGDGPLASLADQLNHDVTQTAMIRVSVHPDTLVAGQPSVLTIELTNTGLGACADVVFRLKLPPGMALVSGRNRIDVNEIRAWQVHIHRVTVLLERPGDVEVGTFISYRDENGLARRQDDWRAPIRVLALAAASLAQGGLSPSPSRPQPRLTVSHGDSTLALDEWDVLEVFLRNTSGIPLQDVTFTLVGPFRADRASGLIELLRDGETGRAAFNIHVTDRGRVPVSIHTTYRYQDERGEVRLEQDDRLTVEVAAPPEPVPPRNDEASVTTILYLVSQPNNAPMLNSYQEMREVKELLRHSRDRERFQLVSLTAARLSDISQALGDYSPQIVHFSGHGLADGSLVFEDSSGGPSLASPAVLASLLSGFAASVRCVIVNASHSLALAEALSEQVDYVIGMRSQILDSASVQFSVGFYQGLFAGKTVPDAFRHGLALLQTDPATNSESGVPVLLVRRKT